MKKRKWTSEQKLQIVMQGARGRAVSEICNEYQINQSQYYLWRDQFCRMPARYSRCRRKAQQQTRLERENERLKAMVGELTMELKKRRLVKHKRCRPRAEPLPTNRCSKQIRVIKSEHPFSGLSQSLGILEICCRSASQSKARLSSALGKQFARSRRSDPPLAKRVSDTRKAAPGTSQSMRHSVLSVTK
jgi:transposase-like protein